MARKNITYHRLNLIGQDDSSETFSNLNSLLNYIQNKETTDRKFNIPQSEKFMYLKEVRQTSDNLLRLLFVSAKHSYSAPLINSVNLESRPNPKTMTEGERVKTHVVIKYDNLDVYVLLESGGLNLKLSTILKYLNYFASNYTRETNNPINLFEGSIIPRNDFIEVLNDMERVLSAEFIMKKQVLGDDFLKLSNRMEEVVDKVKVKITATRNHSIKDTVQDVFAHLNGNRREIVSLRVRGRMPNNDESLIDTNVIIKKNYVEVEQNPNTGEFITEMMFEEIERLTLQL